MEADPREPDCGRNTHSGKKKITTETDLRNLKTDQKTLKVQYTYKFSKRDPLAARVGLWTLIVNATLFMLPVKRAYSNDPKLSDR